MVKTIIVLIEIQNFIFLFTIKEKSVRLLVKTRACSHLSKTFVKLAFTYCVRFYIHS